MAQRPPAGSSGGDGPHEAGSPDGAPQKGSPEYNWLYGGGSAGAGDQTRPVPRTGGPDSTRVMPTVPREQAAAGAGAAPTQPVKRPVNPNPPGPTAPPARTTGGWRRFRWRWLWLLLVAWLVFLVAVPIWAWTKVSTVDAFPRGDRPADQPGTTYLIVGSDSRAGLSPAERKRLGTGGAAGQRTDTIMLLHTGAGPNLLMSIPRDSLVDIPDYGRTKINAAFAYGGPKLLIRTVENNTGIRIDHYVEIGFGGFVNVVDAVGGIEICPTTAMKDPLANLDVKKGCQEADGATALGYARSRHTSALGDIDRARHQREVVSAVGHKAVSPWTVLNPVRYVRLSTAAAESLRVSKGTGPFDMARFAWAMTRVSGDKGLTCSVPIANLAVEWDPERSQEMFTHIIEDDTEGITKALCRPDGLPKT
jgi:LCP family protein required for cell wall assembly